MSDKCNIEKVCTRCSQSKPVSEFTPQKGGRLGVTSRCRVCIALECKEYREKNRNNEEYRKRLREHKAKYYKKVSHTKEFKEKERVRSSNYYKKNSEKIKKSQIKWAKLNPYKKRAANKKYEQGKNKRTPPWLTDQHYHDISMYYWLAQDLKKVTGDTYHVDHIVPLNGKDVCGLHVPWNLQVLPENINLSKGASYHNEHSIKEVRE